ncbi:MAG TPA: hypothetical protein VGE62_00120 [Candidatus Paceibacterota bacterium]
MKTNGKMEWQNSRLGAIALTRKGLIPRYISELWTKSHNGISPLKWKIMQRCATITWFLTGAALLLASMWAMQAYGLAQLESVPGQVASYVLMAVLFIITMIGNDHLRIFRTMRLNWLMFESGFRELERIFYFEGSFPETEEDFVAKVNETLIEKARIQIKEKARTDFMSSSPMRDLYDAAKEFGILGFPNEGYKHYFAEAQRRLDKEELPLFHKES